MGGETPESTHAGNSDSSGDHKLPYFLLLQYGGIFVSVEVGECMSRHISHVKSSERLGDDPAGIERMNWNKWVYIEGRGYHRHRSLACELFREVDGPNSNLFAQRMCHTRPALLHPGIVRFGATPYHTLPTFFFCFNHTVFTLFRV